MQKPAAIEIPRKRCKYATGYVNNGALIPKMNMAATLRIKNIKFQEKKICMSFTEKNCDKVTDPQNVLFTETKGRFMLGRFRDKIVFRQYTRNFIFIYRVKWYSFLSPPVLKFAFILENLN